MVLFAYMRRIRAEQLQKVADAAASKARGILPIEKAKQAMPVIVK